jgi:hypothetical protein
MLLNLLRRCSMLLALLVALAAVLLGGVAAPALARGAHHNTCGRSSTMHIHGHSHKACPKKPAHPTGSSTPSSTSPHPHPLPPDDQHPPSHCPLPNSPRPGIQPMVACFAV